MKVLLIFAHPDDETFAVSGTTKLLSEKNAEVTLVLATKGEEGSLGNPPLTTRQELAQTREKEVRNAAKLTGISRVSFLDYRDGSLSSVPLEEIEKKITHFLHEETPNVVITFEKDGITLHPDHIVISKTVTKCFKKYMLSTKNSVKLYHICLPKSYLDVYHKNGFEYNHYGKMTGVPDEKITISVDVTSIYENKVKAMRCHKTQSQDCEMLLKMENLIPGKRYEHFQLVAENSSEGPSLDL